MTATEQRQAATRRIPSLALVAWTLAAAVLVVLVVAVSRYLRSDGGGMHMHAAMALARGGSAQPVDAFSGSTLFTAWHLDAVALAVLVVTAAAYLTAAALVPVRSPGATWPVHRTLLFLAGLAVCGYATCGSIAVYDQVLFTAHMAGHLALVMVAPALLVAGSPLRLALDAAPAHRRPGLERALRGRIVSVITAPPVTLACYAAVIVGSHLTGLMDTIMGNVWAGQLEHLVYLLVGYQFFVVIVGNEPIRWKLASPARWLLLAIAMAVDTFTGIVLMQGTTAVRVLHSTFNADTLSDTRNGGAIMWFGGDAIMAAIMIGLVIGWLRTVETAAADRGWLEQARSATFTAHTGSADAEALDDDDAARAAYNSWLAKLDR